MDLTKYILFMQGFTLDNKRIPNELERTAKTALFPLKLFRVPQNKM